MTLQGLLTSIRKSDRKSFQRRLKWCRDTTQEAKILHHIAKHNACDLLSDYVLWRQRIPEMEVPLHVAVRKKFYRMVNYILSLQSQPISTLLVNIAIRNHDMRMIRLFFQHRYQISDATYTCFSLAITLGEAEIVEYLLNQGIDAAYADNLFVEQAATSQHMAIVDILAQSYRDRTMAYGVAFLTAADMDYLSDMQQIYAKWSCLDFRIKNQALALALRNDNVTMMSWLTEIGAELTSIDPDAIEIAVVLGNKTALRYVMHNVKPHLASKLLRLAISYAQTEIFQLLMQHMQPRECVADLVDLACRENQAEILKFLLSHDSGTRQVQCQNLEYLAAVGNFAVVSVLVSHGHCGHHDSSLILAAALEVNHTCCRYLIQNNADITDIKSHIISDLDLRRYFRRIRNQRRNCGLQKLAAKCYVITHDVLPDPDIIPEKVYDRLRLYDKKLKTATPVLRSSGCKSIITHH